MNHDIARSRGQTPAEFWNIPINFKDKWFNPQNTSGLITQQRHLYAAGTNTSSAPRNQIMGQTSYVDLNPLYGNDPARLLRVWDNTTGKFRVQNRGALGDFPLKVKDFTPAFTGAGGATANALAAGLPTEQYTVGDSIINLYPLASASLIVWMREHNRLVDELKAKHPDWDPFRLFDEARRWTIAEFQAISFNEYYPATVGRPMTPYAGKRRWLAGTTEQGELT